MITITPMMAITTAMIHNTFAAFSTCPSRLLMDPPETVHARSGLSVRSYCALVGLASRSVPDVERWSSGRHRPARPNDSRTGAQPEAGRDEIRVLIDNRHARRGCCLHLELPSGPHRQRHAQRCQRIPVQDPAGRRAGHRPRSHPRRQQSGQRAAGQSAPGGRRRLARPIRTPDRARVGHPRPDHAGARATPRWPPRSS
jgi:hypothetical protein